MHLELLRLSLFRPRSSPQSSLIPFCERRQQQHRRPDIFRYGTLGLFWSSQVGEKKQGYCRGISHHAVVQRASFELQSAGDRCSSDKQPSFARSAPAVLRQPTSPCLLLVVDLHEAIRKLATEMQMQSKYIFDFDRAAPRGDLAVAKHGSCF